MKTQGASEKTGVKDTKKCVSTTHFKLLEWEQFRCNIFPFDRNKVYYPMINYYICVVGVVVLIGMAPIGSYF